MLATIFLRILDHDTPKNSENGMLFSISIFRIFLPIYVNSTFGFFILMSIEAWNFQIIKILTFLRIPPFQQRALQGFRNPSSKSQTPCDQQYTDICDQKCCMVAPKSPMQGGCAVGCGSEWHLGCPWRIVADRKRPRYGRHAGRTFVHYTKTLHLLC